MPPFFVNKTHTIMIENKSNCCILGAIKTLFAVLQAFSYIRLEKKNFVWNFGLTNRDSCDTIDAGS